MTRSAVTASPSGVKLTLEQRLAWAMEALGYVLDHGDGPTRCDMDNMLDAEFQAIHREMDRDDTTPSRRR